MSNSKRLTKKRAKALLLGNLPPDQRTDANLARALGITPVSVYNWGGDDQKIPVQRHWQVMAIMAERRERGEPPPNLEEG